MQGEIIDGRWEILESIGKGGMGEVFVARHTTLETHVALKLLKPELSQDSTIREKMISEAKAAAKVRHPNVVVVSDVGQTRSGLVFIVMEHVDGDDLKTLLEREGPLSIPRARALLVQLASGLTAAHARSVIHRDIKPANCVVAKAANDTEVLKILDFGIAKILEDENDTAKVDPTTNRWFTRHYVAPEVERGHPSSERSDVYSFGVLAYRMLTGHYPYERSFKAITPPGHYRAELPGDLCELIRDMLEPDPEDRPASMARVCQRLMLECPSGSLSSATLPDERVSDTASSPQVVPRVSPRPSARMIRWALTSGLLGASVPIAMAWVSQPPAPVTLPQAASLAMLPSPPSRGGDEQPLSDAGSGSDTDSSSGSGSATDRGQDDGSGSSADSGSGSATDRGQDDGSGSDTDSSSGSGSATDRGQDDGSGSSADSGSGSATDRGSDTGSGSATDRGSDIGSGSVTDRGSDIGSGSSTDSVSRSPSGPESGPRPRRTPWKKKAQQLVSKYLEPRCAYDEKVTIAMTVKEGLCFEPEVSRASAGAKACIEAALHGHDLALADREYEVIEVRLSP